MQSPGTGSMILSMYYPIFEDQRCIGYVGAGVYASHLMDSLLNLNIKGLPGSEYVFLNVETGVYLYHEDETLLNTSTTESGYLEILRRIQEDGGTQANTYSYWDEAGVRQLVVYKYLRDRGWVSMVRDNATEVYGAVTMVRVLVGVMCAVTAAAVILITLLILRREGRELMVVERAIGRLGDLNLSADQELEPFYGRFDEIGMIAQTTHGVCSCLRKTIDDVGRILGEMAQGTTEQASSVEGLMENVTSITAQIQTSAVRCGSATQQVGLATSYAAEADTRMEQLTTATQHIDQSSTQIGTIINTIEDIAFQTSILALNAAVEAAREGVLRSGGRGPQSGGKIRRGRPEHQPAHQPLHSEREDGERVHGSGRLRHAGHQQLHPVHQDADGRDRRRQRPAVGDDLTGGNRDQGDFRGGPEQLRRGGEKRGGIAGAVPAGAGLEWPHQPFPHLRGGGKRTGTGPVAGWYADGHKHTGSGACSGKISRRN